MKTFTGLPYARSLQLGTHIIISNLSALSACRRVECNTLSGLAADGGLAIPHNLYLCLKKERKKNVKISLFRNLKMDFSSTLGSNFSASSSFFHFFFVPNLLNVIQDWVCVCASECGKYPKARRQMTRVAAHTLESQMYLYMVYGFVLQSFTFFLI